MLFRTRWGNERGASAVEFALILPVFMLLVYGALAFGLALSLKHTMTEAAAEGSRSAIGAQMIAGDANQNAAYVRVALARAQTALGHYSTYATVTPTVQAPCPNAAANQSASVCVQVQISYPYSAHPIIPNAPGLGLVIPSTIATVFTVQVS